MMTRTLVTPAARDAATEEKRRVLAELLARKVGRADRFPVSFAQQRLWFLDQLEPGSALYNMPMAVRLDGPLDPQLLERGLTEVVRRHEVLRTRFEVENGEPIQVISPAASWILRLVDLSGLTDAQRRAEMDRRLSDEVVRPFDLAAGPLLRTTLLRLDHDTHILMATMHHIVSDGCTASALSRQLARS
jgi:NRPS condensation-like uncharacterized protein